MMIKETERIIKRKVFNAICSTCGDEGPDAETAIDAIAFAEDEGWRHKTIYKEGEAIELFRCDECFEKLLDEQDRIIESLDPENQ